MLEATESWEYTAMDLVSSERATKGVRHSLFQQTAALSVEPHSATSFFQQAEPEKDRIHKILNVNVIFLSC